MSLLKKTNHCILFRPKQRDVPIKMNLPLPNLEDVQKTIGTRNIYCFFQETETFLNQKFKSKPSKAGAQNIQEQSFIKKIGFYFLTITGLIKHGLGSFLFGLNLFSLIEGLPKILLNLLTLSYSLLDSFFFLAFEIKLLQKNLWSYQKTQSVIEKHTKQISVLYQQLSNIELLNCLTIHEYEQLHKLSEYFLQHLTIEQQQLKKRLNTPSSKFLSYFLITLGGISKLSSSYFFCQTFLKTFLPQLIGGILGIVFTASIVVGSMGLYFSVNGTGIYQFMHGEINTLNHLEHELPKLEDLAHNTRQNYAKTLNLLHSFQQLPPHQHLTLSKSP